MKSSASEPNLSSTLGNLPRSPSLQLLEIFIEEDFCKKKCLKSQMAKKQI